MKQWCYYDNNCVPDVADGESLVRGHDGRVKLVHQVLVCLLIARRHRPRLYSDM